MSAGDDETPPGGPAPTLPMSWSSGTTDSWNNPGTSFERPEAVKSSAIVQPSAREMAVFSDQRIKTCGTCKHYKHAHAQREFERTHGLFFKELVRDMGWKIRHLGSHPRQLAICGQKDDTLVGPNSRACEYHKPDR